MLHIGGGCGEFPLISVKRFECLEKSYINVMIYLNGKMPFLYVFSEIFLKQTDTDKGFRLRVQPLLDRKEALCSVLPHLQPSSVFIARQSTGWGPSPVSE